MLDVEIMILKPRIVASLGKSALDEVLSAKDAEMIEVRLDLVAADPLETIKAIRKSTNQPIIATNRLATEGGRFEGSERKRIELLLEASDYADYVDIELRSGLRNEFMSKVNKPVIVSYHDFSGTPRREELQAMLEEMKRTGAAIAKIAITPMSLKDNLSILDFLLDADMPLCIIAMGGLGRHMRAVAPIYGSLLTYGYVAEPTAPGQMKVADLKAAMKMLGYSGCSCSRANN
jgi:3-dehydroquinate dehydratase-1